MIMCRAIQLRNLPRIPCGKQGFGDPCSPLGQHATRLPSWVLGGVAKNSEDKKRKWSTSSSRDITDFAKFDIIVF